MCAFFTGLRLPGKGGAVESLSDAHAGPLDFGAAPSASADQPVQRIEGFGAGFHSEADYEEISKLLMEWAAADPRAALVYAREHFDFLHRNLFLSKILAQWARTDSHAAWNWTRETLPDDYTQYDAVLAEVSRSNPDLAWGFATELAAGKPPSYAQTIYVSALRGMAYTGQYEKAARLISTVQLPPGQEQFDLTSFLAGEWGRYDPKNAARWAMAIPDQTSLAYRQTLTSLGLSWAQSNPEEAADFAAHLPPGVARQNTLAVALDSWATEHPEDAAGWLNRNAQDPDFDLVTRTVATAPRMMDSHPDVAISWANTIIDDDIRLQALKIVMRRWKETNPAAASNYLRTSTDLSPEILEDLKTGIY